nr:nucleotide-binding alpha-beta plait domain-containing protein [Tanacetum cinerariifolium]
MVMSGSQISNEDDVQNISTSVFVINFPDGFGAKDLWNTCKLYGHVQRSGFVPFIKVLDIDRLINNLCTVWVGRNKIHANVARFQREPLHIQSNKVNNKGTINVNHGAKGMTNSYTYVVKRNQFQNVHMEECPNMVLEETCLNHEDFSLCLLGKVKEFASLTNLKVVLVGSWFSQIIQAHNDFVIDERVIWVEVEGVPCKWWSRNTFSCIACRWGTLLNGEELEEKGYHSNRIFIRTKLKTIVFDSFKMVYRGMTCWVRAIDVPGWVPDFEENGEEGDYVNDGSHEDDMYGGVSENLKDVEGESDREEVPETNFEEVPDKSIFEGNSIRQNDVDYKNPFGIYKGVLWFYAVKAKSNSKIKLLSILQSSSSPPTADGFETGTPVPSPQSQSFSRGYGSILPTSLAYIVPSTRGCSPWRPDAVMSTTGRGRHSVLRIFKGRLGRTGNHATCGALQAAGPYLRLSRFQGGQAVK